MAGDDALQDREAPLDDDAPELQQRGGRQLVGRRGLALADALQRLLRRLEAPAQAVLFRAGPALRPKLFLALPGPGFPPSLRTRRPALLALPPPAGSEPPPARSLPTPPPRAPRRASQRRTPWHQTPTRALPT